MLREEGGLSQAWSGRAERKLEEAAGLRPGQDDSGFWEVPAVTWDEAWPASLFSFLQQERVGVFEPGSPQPHSLELRSRQLWKAAREGLPSEGDQDCGRGVRGRGGALASLG